MVRFVIAAFTIMVSAAVQAEAACVLKSEPAKTVQGCNVAVGYSNGTRVGEFRQAGKVVGLSKACTTDSRLHDTLGRITASNKIVFSGTTFTLSDDCRSSVKN